MSDSSVFTSVGISNDAFESNVKKHDLGALQKDFLMTPAKYFLFLLGQKYSATYQ